MNKTSFFASTLIAAALLTAAALNPSPAQAQAAGATLTLEVQNVRAGQGPVMVAVFNTEQNWRGRETGAVRTARVDATGTTVRVRFENLPAGSYGIRLFQDLDANGDLNTGFMGIPSEPYAFSNNAPIRFGPPSWAAVRFALPAAGGAHAVALTR
jgi:uncharacterized protein (DUF2141 family)